MKIHLIPDIKLDKELYTKVLSLLQAVRGVNKFYASGEGRFMLPEEMQEEQEIHDQEYFEKQRFSYNSRLHIPAEIIHQETNRTWSFPHIRFAVRWRNFFKEIQQFRLEIGIPEQQFALLLTPIANKKNWFAVLDEEKPYNGFIHTDEWEHFISCDPAFPIAYEVIALTLQKHIFESYSQTRLLTHERSIGCVSDLCMKKSDIILKMRTVLYAQNFRQTSAPSMIVIRRGGRIYLPDYGNIEIKMPTMEKALYILFLRHPQGIYISSLNEYKNELVDIYSRISTRGLMEDMKRRIDEMTNILNDQISVKISRIKRVFTDAIGNSLAEHYIIQGENAERKNIKLDRVLVKDNINPSN